MPTQQIRIRNRILWVILLSQLSVVCYPVETGKKVWQISDPSLPCRRRLHAMTSETAPHHGSKTLLEYSTLWYEPQLWLDLESLSGPLTLQPSFEPRGLLLPKPPNGMNLDSYAGRGSPGSPATHHDYLTIRLTMILRAGWRIWETWLRDGRVQSDRVWGRQDTHSLYLCVFLQYHGV